MVAPSTFLIDTNLITRLVTGDPADLAAASERAFQRAARGDWAFQLPALVVGEAVFVLSSFYKRPRQEVAEALRAVMALPGVRVPEASALLHALDLFEQRPALHFVDAYLIASAEQIHYGVATLDAAIRKAELVTVLDPANL